MAKLDQNTIAVLATNGFEDSELTRPVDELKQAGATVTVVSDSSDQITGKDGTSVPVDTALGTVRAADFDGLLLPGGVANPDTMRMNPTAVDFVRDFFDQHKPVAAICHGPWLLVEADVVRDRTLTSWPSLKTDIRNAGGTWVDQEVVVDRGLVTSRKPDDLDAFCASAVDNYAAGQQVEQAG